MFNHNPYGGYGGYPQTPVVFIPSPGTPQTDPLADIQQQIGRLEALKKIFKEEKKDDKDKKKEEAPNVVTVALFMILIAPITGPIMSKFFNMGLGMLPHATP